MLAGGVSVAALISAWKTGTTHVCLSLLPCFMLLPALVHALEEVAGPMGGVETPSASEVVAIEESAEGRHLTYSCIGGSTMVPARELREKGMSTTSSPQRSMPLPSADTASGLSHFFLSWVAPLVLKGSRKRLTRADVPDCPEKLRSDVADNIYEQAEAAWNAEVEHARTAGRTPSVVRGPARCVAGRYFWMGQSLTGLSGLLVTLVRPMLLREISPGSSVESVSTVLGQMTAAGALSEFLVNPMMGRLGDKYGRKPFLVGALLTTAFANLVTFVFMPRLPGLALPLLVVPATHAANNPPCFVVVFGLWFDSLLA